MKTFLLALLLTALALTSAQAATIFKDTFDDNLSLAGWDRTSSTYAVRNTGSYKVGEASLKIAGPYEAVTYVNCGPFRNLVLSFKMAGITFSPDDRIEAYCDYGTGYVKIATLYYAQANGTFRSYSFNVPQGYRYFKIKFKMFADGTTRLGFIDDVLLTGTW